jgi:hypothetical protein
MDGLREFLDDLKRRGLAEGNLLGLFHVVVGRRIQTAAGELISNGVTWRELAEMLKRVRWPKDSVRELGIDPDTLAPRDRQRFWFQAISQARVDSPEAAAAGQRLAETLNAAGYVISPPPARPAS